MQASPPKTEDLSKLLAPAYDQTLVGLVALDWSTKLWSAKDKIKTEAMPDYGLLLEGDALRVRYVRVLEDAGAAVRVETLSKAPCSRLRSVTPMGGLDLTAWVSLSGWVSRSAILPLTAKTTSQRHADGTGVRVLAGRVPQRSNGRLILEPWDGLQMEVDAKNLRFSVPEDLKFSPPSEQQGASKFVRLDLEAGDVDMSSCGELESRILCEGRLAGSFDTGPFGAWVGGKLAVQRTDKERFGPLDAAYTFAAGRTIPTRETVSPGKPISSRTHELLFRTECEEVVALSDTLPKIFTGTARGYGGGGGWVSESVQCTRVHGGYQSTLHWQDGSRAGTLHGSMEIALSRPAPGSGLVCMSDLFFTAAEPLCLNVADLHPSPHCTWPQPVNVL